MFLQHTDSKPEQQRLVCLDSAADARQACAHPFMMLDDVGLTFGRATLLNLNVMSGMNHREWAAAPVWKYATSCVGNLPRSLTGTLRDPLISEEGRRFLAARLMQLSDAQLRNLFEAARVQQRSAGGRDDGAAATVAEWVATFKEKRAEIVNRRCADDWSSQAPLLFKTTPTLWLQSMASPRLTAAMNAISLFGYAPFYVALAVLLAFTVNVRAGASLIVLLALSTVIADAAKIVVSYPRPDAVDPRVEALSRVRLVADDSGTHHIIDRLPAPARAVADRFTALASSRGTDDGYGFPSGHVANAIACLCGLVFLFRWRGAWVAAALWVPLIAASRIYLGRHFPADVIGGLAAGLVATLIVVRALNLQRLGERPPRRVLIKAFATAALCALLALTTPIPPVYESGQLVGAIIALALVSWAASPDYDHAAALARVGRLVFAGTVFGVVWTLMTTPLQASGGHLSAMHAFIIGAIPLAILVPAPIFVELGVRRLMEAKRSRDLASG